MANYTLNVRNNSVFSGTVCVYATQPDGIAIQKNLLSLAWLTKTMNPGSVLTLEWPVDFSFIWSEQGELTPGVRFEASQAKKADPQNPSFNRAYLDYVNGAYTFGEPANAITPPTGAMNITASGSVPNKEASIGIAIAGKPALVTQAGANLNYTFLPHLKYWLAFGDFVQGEVLDLDRMTSVFPIEFPLNRSVVNVALNENNTWSLKA